MKTFIFLLETGEKLTGQGRGLFAAFQAAVNDNINRGDGTKYSFNQVVNHQIKY